MSIIENEIHLQLCDLGCRSGISINYGLLKTPDQIWLTWHRGSGLSAAVEKIYPVQALKDALGSITSPPENNAALMAHLASLEILSPEMPSYLQQVQESNHA